MSLNLDHVVNPVVIYHGPCLDGWTAAYLAHRQFPGAELVEHAPGRPTYEGKVALEGRHVLILDVAFPHQEHLRIRSVAASLLILDHHAASRTDAIQGSEFFVWDDKRSGAGLALDFFFHGAREVALKRLKERAFEGEPYVTLLGEAALLIESRDLWKFDLADARAYCAYANRFKQTVAQWGHLLNERLSVAIQKGNLLLDAQQEQVERIAKHAFTVEWPEGRLLAVNTPVLQSEVCEALYEQEGAHVGSLAFYLDLDGWWRCSLRSKKGKANALDCNKAAARLGGGGHPPSAGFRVRDLDDVRRGRPENSTDASTDASSWTKTGPMPRRSG